MAEPLYTLFTLSFTTKGFTFTGMIGLGGEDWRAAGPK